MLKWKNKLCIFLATTTIITATPIFNTKAFVLDNGTMMQYFEWYLPNDGTLWNKVNSESSNLKNAGITALWLPPAYKGTSATDVGYG